MYCTNSLNGKATNTILNVAKTMQPIITGSKALAVTSSPNRVGEVRQTAAITTLPRAVKMPSATRYIGKILNIFIPCDCSASVFAVYNCHAPIAQMLQLTVEKRVKQRRNHTRESRYENEIISSNADRVEPTVSISKKETAENAAITVERTVKARNMPEWN